MLKSTLAFGLLFVASSAHSQDQPSPCLAPDFSEIVSIEGESVCELESVGRDPIGDALLYISRCEAEGEIEEFDTAILPGPDSDHYYYFQRGYHDWPRSIALCPTNYVLP